jgi:hypothetical protein
MKTFLALGALAVLAGCATYGDPYGYGYPVGAYPSAGVVYQSGPAYGHYGGYSSYPAYPAAAYPSYPRSGYPASPSQRGMRDRDGDGIPNRVDNDRDGDGVPNRFDSRPNNPRR